jgi:hypothetical protein
VLLVDLENTSLHRFIYPNSSSKRYIGYTTTLGDGKLSAERPSLPQGEVPKPTLAGGVNVAIPANFEESVKEVRRLRYYGFASRSSK